MLTIVRNRKPQTHRRIVAFAAGAIAVLAISGCHKKKVAPPPPPPPPVSAPAPTANITAEPDTVNAGQAVVLTWHTTDANSAEINNGIGQVPTAGTQTVNPTESTTYTLTATGDGGNATASARVTVSAPPAPPSAPTETNITDQTFHQNVKDIFYDYDSYSIRPDAQSTIQQDASFLNQHPNLNVVIGGYCDERGSVEYNLALGENRANAAKQALVADGVNPNRLRTVSYGKEKQFCTEHTESCWQLNRRAAFSMDR